MLREYYCCAGGVGGVVGAAGSVGAAGVDVSACPGVGATGASAGRSTKVGVSDEAGAVVSAGAGVSADETVVAGGVAKGSLLGTAGSFVTGAVSFGSDVGSCFFFLNQSNNPIVSSTFIIFRTTSLFPI